MMILRANATLLSACPGRCCLEDPHPQSHQNGTYEGAADQKETCTRVARRVHAHYVQLSSKATDDGVVRMIIWTPVGSDRS